MSYIITPSEKARIKTNPQPVGLQYNAGIHPIRLLFKNIFGLPIPFLQILVSVGLLASSFILEASLGLILILGLLYLISDLFAQRRDLRAFFTGFEWFYISFIIFLLIANHFDFNGFLNSIIYYRWIAVLIILPYVFYLFPGINRHLYILIFGGLALAIFGIFQHFSGLHPLIENYPIFYSYTNLSTYVASGFFYSSITYGLVILSINAFVCSRGLLEYKDFGKINYLYVAIAIILFVSSALTYDFRIWILSVLSLIIPSFFISKKYFMICTIALLTLFYFAFWLIGPFREVFLFVQSNFNQLQVAMYATNTEWFEVINKHLWLGEQSFSLNLYNDLTRQSSAELNLMQNSYLLLLKQVGVVGFSLFIIFFAQSLLLNLRLLKDIPQSHTWHKVLALGALSIQVNMHLAALFFPVFSQTHILFFFVILVSILTYYDDAYGVGIVPDDSCL